MRTIAGWGLRYGAAAFLLGTALGTIRILWVAPRLGTLGAVLAEAPVMLAASWLIARALLARCPLASRGAALGAGLLGFAVVMACELALGRWGFGLSTGAWAATLATAPGALGLAAQALFALLPAAAWCRPGPALTGAGRWP